MKPLERFAHLARAHLLEHRPRMARQLQAEGRLDQYAEERSKAARRILVDLVGHVSLLVGGDRIGRGWPIAP